ncbi:MAG TPA: apolipoprotein N-acyltransferase, partial [Mycobacteriales bacterium]|nr:apolipoprotein N-acyltransferase [Mycobacteriales bacterium]
MPSTPLRLVVAAAAGSSMWLAFPPVSLAVAGPLGVALFLAAVLPYRGVALRARSAALVGMVAGLAFFVPLLSWLAAIGIDAWLALAAVEAVFLAALAIAVGRVSHLPGWWAWTACLWVAEEALRSRVPFGGFSWGRLAFAQPGGPWGRYAALGGAPVVSLVVAVLGALVVVMVRAAWAIRAGGRRSAVRRGLGALLGVAALTGLGFAV